MKVTVLLICCMILPTNLVLAEEGALGSPEYQMKLDAQSDPGNDLEAPEIDINNLENFDRVSFYASKSNRGNTIFIDERYVAYFCGDFDGCRIRLGMYNWDNAGRVASRSTLLYYNVVNHTWRAMNGDPSGTDYDGVVQHVLQAWDCYMTDGKYEAFQNKGDPELGFGLLSYNSKYNAACRLTIID